VSSGPLITPTPVGKVRGRAGSPAGLSDRYVTLLAIALAGGFVGLAVTVLFIPLPAGMGTWLPLHLLLAGAAPTAIAGVMPFFSAAVSGAPPAGRKVRLSAISGVAAGALLVVGGWSFAGQLGPAGSVIASLGGLVYLAGLLALAAATLLPLRSALGPRRIFMGAIYGLALLNVLLGASLSTLFVMGWAPILEAWTTLKPAHAWLNVFGFVSLVIAGSLLHLLPTVAGARIRRTRASLVAFVGLAAGPLMVALGFVLRSDVLAVGGAGVVVAGAAALCWHAFAVLRSRAAWSSDRSWHTFTTWSLLAGIGWFMLGSLVAAGHIVGAGASPAGWQLMPLIAPLAIGWAGQVLIGSWSHLLPAVGPGSLAQHARQRGILGRAALLRLLLLNGGVAALIAADALGQPLLSQLGAGSIVMAGVTSLLLLVGALLSLAAGGPGISGQPATAKR
jgi:nitrite reductase (NO-forming)